MAFATLFRRARAFGHDQSGNILILSAAFTAVACACAALAIDFGSIYFERRHLQGAVDMAAISGAQNVAEAESAVRTHLARNGYPEPGTLTVEVGRYRADAAIGAESRFAPAGADANAVRVSMTHATPIFFLRMFITGDSVPIAATAVAVNTRFAQFSIGSRLASLDGGIANALLSKMLGGTVSLSMMDYEALAGAKVDVFSFSRALATQLDLEAATFDNLAAVRMSVGDVYSALATLGSRGELDNSGAAAVLSRLVSQTDAARMELDFGRLIGFGPYAGNATESGTAPGAATTVGVLDLVAASAAVANGNRQVDLGLGATVPGLARTEVSLVIGERPRTSPWLTLGDSEATVRTAQTRLMVDITVGGTGLLSGVEVKLPLYLELAAAEARLSDVACGARVEDTRVALAVKPSLIEAWIGTVDPAQARNFASTPAVASALLAKLPLLSLNGSAHARAGNLDDRIVEFAWADIQSLTAKSVASRDIARSLTASLVQDLDIRIEAGPLVIPTPLLLGALGEALGRAAAPVDGVLNSVLALAGLRLGEADVWVNGVRCDGAALVQ